MKNHQPNAVERKWREKVRGYGSVVSGEGHSIVIHHPCGRTQVHDKVPIGHYFLLPLTTWEHDLLHSNKKAFDEMALEFEPEGRWDCEKALFFRMIRTFEDWGEPVPPGHVLEAIKGFRR